MLDYLYLLGMCAWLWISFALLALSQERHRERVLGCAAPFALSGRAQRTLALIAIAVTLPLCIALDGAAFGSLLWALLLSVGAACVALTLTVCPRLLRPLAWLLGR